MVNHTDSGVILIGGVTGGLGTALAKRLTELGYRVAGFSRDPRKCEALEAEVPNVRWLEADAEKSASVEQAFAQAEDQVGPLTGYAHCVGSILLKSAHQISDDEWCGTLRRNLDSAFFALRSAVKRMQKRKAGSIVFVSSGAAFGGIPAHEAIAAAKAGVEGLVRSAAASYASRGLRINAVAPGMMDTPMAQPIIGSETGRAFSQAMHPLGRIGAAAEVASLMAWLLSSEASWVSGQTYGIDGGLAHLKQRPKM